MAKSEVFGNRDLTRRIVQAKHGVGLLRASKKIRSEEECAALFEKWQRVGGGSVGDMRLCGLSGVHMVTSIPHPFLQDQV